MNQMILEMFGERGLTLMDRELLKASALFKKHPDTIIAQAMKDASENLKVFEEKIEDLKTQRRNISSEVSKQERKHIKRNIDSDISLYNNKIVTIRRMFELVNSIDEQERQDLVRLCEKYIEDIRL